MDCHVANAPRNDVGGALLAMAWGVLVAITWERAGVEVCKKNRS